jgi:hypothetical protein
MYLHKTGGMADGKAVPEPSARNAASKPPPSTQAAKPSAPAPPAVPRSASALVAATGLPMDKLSASIVAFARFFSLPLKPELMAAMRRQTLATPSTAATQPETALQAATEKSDTGAAAKNREALSLAAAAAESKGVELHPKALEGFAEAVDPDWQKRQEPGGRNQRGRQDKRHQREEENAPPKTGPAKIAAITAAGLRERALESAEKDPLLAVLNRLPGKNGGRWIVLPFNFDEGGREFNVSMRILLETDKALNRATCVALDIVESEQHWLFVLESASGLPSNRLTVYLQPELPPKAHSSFVRELSGLMEIKPKRILIKTWTESFPYESGCTDDLLRPVNEAV